MTHLEARDYVLDNQDALIAIMLEDKLAEQLIHAYIKFDAAQDDDGAQLALVEAAKAYKEGRGQ